MKNPRLKQTLLHKHMISFWFNFYLKRKYYETKTPSRKELRWRTYSHYKSNLYEVFPFTVLFVQKRFPRNMQVIFKNFNIG